METLGTVAYIDTDLNCCKELSISAGGVSKKLRRVSRMGYHDIVEGRLIGLGRPVVQAGIFGDQSLVIGREQLEPFRPVQLVQIGDGIGAILLAGQL